MAGLKTALVAGLLGALALSAPALADPLEGTDDDRANSPSPIEATFANTVRITTDDSVTYIYFNRDGTFISRSEGGDAFGTWKIEDAKFCTHTKAGDSCGVLQPGRQVGDKWVHRIAGETFGIEIVGGR